MASPQEAACVGPIANTERGSGVHAPEPRLVCRGWLVRRAALREIHRGKGAAPDAQNLIAPVAFIW